MSKLRVSLTTLAVTASLCVPASASAATSTASASPQSPPAMAQPARSSWSGTH